MRKHIEYLFPELTPLIDLVFLLLIFFLVSLVFKKEDVALLLNLPKSSYLTEEVDIKDINIFITTEKINFENEEVSFEDKNKLINFALVNEREK